MFTLLFVCVCLWLFLPLDNFLNSIIEPPNLLICISSQQKSVAAFHWLCGEVVLSLYYCLSWKLWASWLWAGQAFSWDTGTSLHIHGALQKAQLEFCSPHFISLRQLGQKQWMNGWMFLMFSLPFGFSNLMSASWWSTTVEIFRFSQNSPCLKIFKKIFFFYWIDFLTYYILIMFPPSTSLSSFLLPLPLKSIPFLSPIRYQIGVYDIMMM